MVVVVECKIVQEKIMKWIKEIKEASVIRNHLVQLNRDKKI